MIKNLRKIVGWILNTYWNNDPTNASKKICLVKDQFHAIDHYALFNAPVIGHATC